MKQLRNYKSARQIPEELGKNPALNSALEKYGGMGEDALIEQLVAQVRASKQNGAYNPAQMETYISMLSPHLSEPQKRKLNNVMRVIDAEG